ncbi:MAG: DUF3604 domain-containing protein [Pseudomonadales bacterium]
MKMNERAMNNLPIPRQTMVSVLRAISIGGLIAVLSACGADQDPEQIDGAGKAAEIVQAADQRQQENSAQLAASSALSAAPIKPILFGDLHVHTSYSIDGFAMELPVMAQQGTHPPAHACDFARYCASLDFFSYNDHAENLTPEHWQVTKDTVRDCNARAQDINNPDLVAFAGFEWTQVGVQPEKHWGHKNVIFPGTAEDQLPARPISARPRGSTVGNTDSIGKMVKLKYVDPLNWTRYNDLGWLLDRIDEIPDCPKDKDGPALEGYCNEVADTPEDLYRKLDSWTDDYLVIPHGNTWGVYTPVGSSWDKQLNSKQHNKKQGLLEVMSGHGNSEEYRSWDHFALDDKGRAYCPEPTDDFLSCCWQAGEIMRQRCDGLSDEECELRVSDARQKALAAGPYPHMVFPDSQPAEWLNCGQCNDCFKPAISTRPKSSSQYAMAISNFKELDESGRPNRFKFGFIASTDDHTARPGTGYKQYERRKMTFATGMRSDFYTQLAMPKMDDPQQPMTVDIEDGMPDQRVGSFSYPGGILAVHSEGRKREQIWSALKNRQVYGTSGPRMLLWFDLVNADNSRLPMGSEVTMNQSPTFQVRALGDYIQKPGCPDHSVTALSADRLDYICAGDCYNPSDKRHDIATIEVIRIKPQSYAGEPVEQLIEDPWRRFDCEQGGDGEGCVVEFSDTEFNRDSLYYVRALQQATPAINGDYLRTTMNEQGQPVKVEPCYGDFRTDADDDCLAPAQERAWSSPIFVNFQN